MSIELVHFPATATRAALRVIVAVTAAERAQVYALRYDIYVSELGLLPPDHPYVDGRSLRDPFDDRSIQLLLLCGDEPVGTMRLTPASSGPLELEAYRPIDDVPHRRAELCEATRFMVKRAMRRGLAGPALLLATVRAMARAGLRVLLAAGKVGNLGRYYRNVGLEQVGDDHFTYDLVGSARYRLLLLDIGAPWSLARARLRALIAALWVPVLYLGRLGGLALRRGFARATPAPPPARAPHAAMDRSAAA